MNPFKRIFKLLERWVKLYILPPLAALLLFCIGRSIRWVRNDFKNFYYKAPFIAAFWHGRQLMLAPLFQMGAFQFRLAVLISGHTDGRLIARAIRHFGLDSVAGSSTRGGAKALLQLIDILKAGNCVGITPDGPKGPVYKVKDGIIKLAQITGAPIIPIVYGGKSVWQFKSWDAMILPKPWTKAVCLVGAPLFVGSGLSAEELSSVASQLEDALNSLKKEADEYQYA